MTHPAARCFGTGPPVIWFRPRREQWSMHEHRHEHHRPAHHRAPTQDVFDVLSNPERHAEIDASGFVVSDEKTDRITATGQVFRMNMTGDHMGGDYQTDNTVTGYDKNHLLAWQTAPAGTEPPGWEWVWVLDRAGLGQHRGRAHLRLGQGHRPGPARQGRVPARLEVRPRGLPRQPRCRGIRLSAVRWSLR